MYWKYSAKFSHPIGGTAWLEQDMDFTGVEISFFRKRYSYRSQDLM